MDNVIDFLAYKKNKELSNHIQKNKEDPKLIKIEVTPEQLRKIAFSMEQAHSGRVKLARETNEIVTDYDLTVGVQSVDKKSVLLIWYPMR